MEQDSLDIRALLRRAAYASPFVFISLGLLLKAFKSDSLLFGFMLFCYSITFCFIGIAVNIPFFQNILKDHFGHLIPRHDGDRAHFPAYSSAEAMVVRQEYQEALAKYRDIAMEFPEELRPWLEMITVAFKYMQDPDGASQMYAQAKDLFPRPADRKCLTDNYNALKSYFAAGGNVREKKKITFSAEAFEQRKVPVPAPLSQAPEKYAADRDRRTIAFRKQTVSNLPLAIQPSAAAPKVPAGAPPPQMLSREKLTFEPGKKRKPEELKKMAEERHVEDESSAQPARRKISFQTKTSE